MAGNRAELAQAPSWVADTICYTTPLPGSGSLSREGAKAQRRKPLGSWSNVLSTVVAGVLIGASSAALQGAIERLVLLRNQALQHLFQRSLLQAYAAELLLSLAFALAAAALVQLVAPRAAGGGVTWVMAALNGNDIPGLFAWRVYAVKLLGALAARLSTLPLGIEAPTVHIGACVASGVCVAQHRRTSRSRVSPAAVAAAEYAPLPSAAGEAAAAEQPALQDGGSFNHDHREMLSAGAAAGLAAAFGAPIGGVLFALEEACSVWSRQTAWRCFVCAAVAVFTHAQLLPSSESGTLSIVGVDPLTTVQWAQQLPLVVVVSAGGGLLGAAFNKLHMRLRPYRAKPKQLQRRLAEVAVVTTLTISVIALLSATMGRCLPLPPFWSEEEVVRHSCREGEYNDLATGWLSPAALVIRKLLNLGTQDAPIGEGCTLASPCYFSPLSLAALGCSYLALMPLASGLAVPGGQFMPSLLVGGAFGALCGFALRWTLPAAWGIQPGLYALCSATAMLGGVFRGSISLVVVVVEGSHSLDLLFGVITAVAVSNLVALVLSTDSIYEAELERELHVTYLHQEPPPRLLGLRAADLMATPVVGVNTLVPAATLGDLLRYSRHNGFCVYDAAHRDAQAGMGRLAGFVLRSQLEVLLARQAFCDPTGASYLQPVGDKAAYESSLAADMAAAASGTTLGHAGAQAAAGIATARGLAGEGARGGATPYVNLAPFMDPAPPTVRLETPAAHAHKLLLHFSLRHLPVVDERNDVRGIITRQDLLYNPLR